MPRSHDPRRDTHLAKARTAVRGWIQATDNPLETGAAFDTGYITAWDDLAALTQQQPSPRPRGDQR
jgi:hypothetical protein